MRLSMTTSCLCALLTGAAFLAPSRVSACSCTNELTLEQEFGFAMAVFAGRVSSITPEGDGFHVRVMLEPSARWKGGFGSTVPVITPNNEGACGFPFEVDGEYLVFAFNGGSGADPPFFTHLCAKTSSLPGNVYVPQLGPPLVPTRTLTPTWGALKQLYR